MNENNNNLSNDEKVLEDKLPIINNQNSWLSDSDDRVRKNHTYNAGVSGTKYAEMNKKQVYNLVNELIKRKPVQIKENENIFEKAGNGKQKKSLNDSERMPASAAKQPSFNVKSSLQTSKKKENVSILALVRFILTFL